MKALLKSSSARFSVLIAFLLMSHAAFGDSLPSARQSDNGNVGQDSKDKLFGQPASQTCGQSARLGSCSDQGNDQYLCSTNGQYYSSYNQCISSCP